MNVSWMMDLVRTLSRPESAVLPFCAGGCSTARARMQPDLHIGIVECDVDIELQTGAETDPC